MKILVVGAGICLHLLSASVPYRNLIEMTSCQYRVNPRLVAAIVWQESSWNAKAVGEDPGGKSWGLMQIKWSTAKWLGFKGSRKELLNPAVNLHWGIKYLKSLAVRYPYGWDAISAYNLGHPVFHNGWANQNYVNGVFRKYKRLGRKRNGQDGGSRIVQYQANRLR